jgi:metal-responsive CopG/Arc/MetJ family transcriptional regulator
MRQKTSLTLSEDVLAGVEKASRRGESRSETVNRLLRERLADEAAQLVRAREVAQINRHADALNAEAADVLTYQGDV